MNTIIKLLVIASIVAIIGQVMHSVKAYAMYEDQIEICDFKNICKVVNIDDYMDEQHANKLEEQFYQDIDTYSKIQALDEECRDTYHAFCFGDAWSSLKEYLN